MRVKADQVLSTKELGKTQARAKGIMRKEVLVLEQLKLQYSNLLALRDELENIEIIDNDLEQEFNENFESLISGIEALSIIIKIIDNIFDQPQGE
jgi:hypothetical protein